jgi:hypothetical protein
MKAKTVFAPVSAAGLIAWGLYHHNKEIPLMFKKCSTAYPKKFVLYGVYGLFLNIKRPSPVVNTSILPASLSIEQAIRPAETPPRIAANTG